MFAAAEVRTAGRGGLKAVARITGLARSTINRGENDLDGEPLPEGRVRRKGGGRKRVVASDPALVPALKRLVEPVTRGDPVRPLIWVSKSMDKLAEAPAAMGHPISADMVRSELTKLGFSRQHNRKADEGARHPDRNAQFKYINAKVKAAQFIGRSQGPDRAAATRHELQVLAILPAATSRRMLTAGASVIDWALGVAGRLRVRFGSCVTSVQLVHTTARNCARDEGGPFGVGNHGLCVTSNAGPNGAV